MMSGDAGYHRVFWLTTAFTVVVIAIVLLVVPGRPRRSDGTIDWLGAAGLARPVGGAVRPVGTGLLSQAHDNARIRPTESA